MNTRVPVINPRPVVVISCSAVLCVSSLDVAQSSVQGDQLNMAVLFWQNVACPMYAILSLFTRYQNNTAMFIWSGCNITISGIMIKKSHKALETEVGVTPNPGVGVQINNQGTQIKQRELK